MKVIIIGVSGAGKSTLSKKLSIKFQLPVLHLDQIWHGTNYDDAGKKVLRDSQIEFMENNPSWIIDGNYSETLDLRMPHADVIIWFRISKFKSLRRVIFRSLKVRAGLYKRTDMAKDFKEKFDKEYWEFLKFIWNFERDNIPKIEEKISKRKSESKLFVVNSKKDTIEVINFMEINNS